MTFFTPIDRMWERAEHAREDSNIALFHDLLLLGEMLTKIVAAGFVAAIDNDRERHRYQQLYRLVRADGIGDWATAIDDILTGPASQILISPAQAEKRELSQALSSGSWQYDAIKLLNNCVKIIDQTCEDLPSRGAGRRWFSTFARLRNKTRGHGAATPSSVNAMLNDLEQSLRLMIDNLSILKRPWAYLHRNLSGKYRVTKLNPSATRLDVLKSQHGVSLSFTNGVYVCFDDPGSFKHLQIVELLQTNVDAADFFLPNGAFTDKKYELISYITDARIQGDPTPYFVPPSDLPKSETQGIGILEAEGKSFTNLPPNPTDYVQRSRLESELFSKLMDDRHPIITLVGRGGIGKTWLTLTVLHQITIHEKFTAILWFSARDIDLLPEGAKLVKPHILHEGDIADELVRLMAPHEANVKGFKSIRYLINHLTNTPIGPILFVFDNFETVRSPAELFAWLDIYIRLPNKILITTRHRDFKGDYPVDVAGMEITEAEELVNKTSDQLGINSLLTSQYIEDILDEADGHPYIIKILLGEVAKAERLVKIERLIASKDDLLDALFERTYTNLRPVSKRVFLTLCNWRSTVPQIALEAVLLRPVNERMDVRAAVEELERSSFIEVRVSEKDQEIFLSVPLVAILFGKRKLEVDPSKSAIDADTALIREFGSTRQSDIHRGIAPRIERLFRNIAMRIGRDSDDITAYVPMLEYIARQYSPAWLLIANLYDEQEMADSISKIKEAISRYLETSDDDQGKGRAWERLAQLHRRSGELGDELHALVARAELSNASFSDASDAANRLNSMLASQRLVLDTDEKQILAQRIATIMESRLQEADANDFSRLAWLHMHLQNYDKATEYTKRGLEIDPNNNHCLSLAHSLH